MHGQMVRKLPGKASRKLEISEFPKSEQFNYSKIHGIPRGKSNGKEIPSKKRSKISVDLAGKVAFVCGTDSGKCCSICH